MKENAISTRYYTKGANIQRKTDASLQEYLGEVAALECQLWTQDRLSARLAEKAMSLGNRIQVPKPVKPGFSTYNLNKNIFCIVLCSAGVVSLVLLSLAGMFGVGALGFAVGIFLAAIPDYFEYKKNLKVYEKQLKQYNAFLRADEQRTSHEIRVKREIEQQLSQLKVARDFTKQALDTMYSLNIIHPSYRNFVAVSSLYDYFDKGICFQLTGREGAYAFYEEALRFNRIETKLDVIIDKLDMITANQEHIARLIQDTNTYLYRIEQQNDRMATTLDDIGENTAMTEYNTRCTAQSAATMESISIYRLLR